MTALRVAEPIGSMLLLTARPTAPLTAPTIGRLRETAEQEVERLLELLDTLDPDPDLEPAGDELDDGLVDDEPILGSNEPLIEYNARGGVRRAELTQHLWSYSFDTTDREGDEHDGGEPDEDREPSLGSASANEYEPQTEWADLGADDREGDEHDGAEPDEDGEPDLGSFDRMLNQAKSWRQTFNTQWLVGSDCEVDHCDGEDDGTAERTEQVAA